MQDLLDRALGKYVIIEEIGRGGMGAVYKARDVELDRIVAIKVLSPYLVGEPRLVQRFMREARLAANLDHPNIVTIYDIGGEGSYYYFAMKYLEGVTLKEYVVQHGPLPLNEALAIVRQLASALDYAHGQNLIHRDIKPGNVIISSDGQVCLTDFGLAKVAENLKLTASGETIGTLEYMAPEQARGDAEKRSDIYSLAVIVYEMLAGRLPFQGNNQATMLYQHLHDPPPPLHQWNPNIPPEVEQAVLKAMAKDPAERFQTAGEFEQALEDGARHALPVAPLRRPSEPQKVAPAAAAPEGSHPTRFTLPRIVLPRIAWPQSARALWARIRAKLSLSALPPFVQRQPWLLAVGLALLLLLIIGSVALGLALGSHPVTVVTTGTPTATERRPTSIATTPLAPPPPTTTPTPTATPSEPQQLTAAELALICGVDENGEGGKLALWKWGQAQPTRWPGVPNHPVVSLLSWSPQGDRLAMIVAEAGVPNLFTISLDGTDLEKLTATKEEKSDPAWSPDGLQIAYANGPPPPRGKREIYLIPAGGGALTNATSSSEDEWAPAWSGDGAYLVYSLKGGDVNNTEIYRLNLLSSQRDRLTNDPGEDVFPAWAPNRNEIVFLSNRSGDFMLYRMDAAGQGLRLLTDAVVWLERPSWSPDGNWLAFTRRVAGELPQVILLDTVTGKSYLGPSDCRRPAWRPRP
jgi:serine/threonine-protein kinase